jgi:curved DNA-binding protein CbpA
MKNYYQILEVSPDASQEIIKEQYRFLVQAWHPDRFSTPAQKIKAEEKIKEINAAYKILRDPTKRAEYDRITNAQRASTSYESVKEAKRRADEERRNREEAENIRRKAERERESFRQYADDAQREGEEAKRRAEEEKKRRDEAKQGLRQVNTKQSSKLIRIFVALFTLIVTTVLFTTISNSLDTPAIMTRPVLSPTETLQVSRQIARPTSTTTLTPTHISPPIDSTTTQKIIFKDDFQNSNTTTVNWSSLGGTWVVEDGLLSCIANGKYLANITLPEDFTFQLDIMGINAIDKIIVFRAIDDSEHYGIDFRTNPYNDIVLVKSLPGNAGQIIQDVPFYNNNNTWYTVKVDVENNHIKVFINGQQTIDFIDTSSPITGGTVGVGAMLQPGFSVVYYDNIVISHR